MNQEIRKSIKAVWLYKGGMVPNLLMFFGCSLFFTAFFLLMPGSAKGEISKEARLISIISIWVALMGGGGLYVRRFVWRVGREFASEFADWGGEKVSLETAASRFYHEYTLPLAKLCAQQQQLQRAKQEREKAKRDATRRMALLVVRNRIQLQVASLKIRIQDLDKDIQSKKGSWSNKYALLRWKFPQDEFVHFGLEADRLLKEESLEVA